MNDDNQEQRATPERVPERSEPAREPDAAKRLILARRARFVAAALAGAGLSTGSCTESHGRVPDTSSVDGGAGVGSDACLSFAADAGPEVCLTGPLDAGPQPCLEPLPIPEDAGEDAGDEDAG